MTTASPVALGNLEADAGLQIAHRLALRLAPEQALDAGDCMGRGGRQHVVGRWPDDRPLRLLERDDGRQRRQPLLRRDHARRLADAGHVCGDDGGHPQVDAQDALAAVLGVTAVAHAPPDSSETPRLAQAATCRTPSGEGEPDRRRSPSARWALRLPAAGSSHVRRVARFACACFGFFAPAWCALPSWIGEPALAPIAWRRDRFGPRSARAAGGAGLERRAPGTLRGDRQWRTRAPAAIGETCLLAMGVAAWLVRPPYRIRLFLQQCEFVGVGSLFIVS